MKSGGGKLGTIEPFISVQRSSVLSADLFPLSQYMGAKGPLFLLFQNQHSMLVETSQQIKLKIIFR